MPTVIYDADCGFCRFSLALLLAWDRSGLRPLALGTLEADRLLADLTEAERNASWHLVLDDGTRFSAGAALGPALRRPGRFPTATERGYRWVADHRGALGRLVGARARRWADRVIAAHGGPPQ
jgi:predicted DCC family thiol-disulfide oxidoreductase YuxK